MKNNWDLSIVAYLVGDDEELYEDENLIEEYQERIEEIIKGILDYSKFEFEDVAYEGGSCFRLAIKTDQTEEQILDFFNGDMKYDSWLEGDMSINDEYNIDFKCEDLIQV